MRDIIVMCPGNVISGGVNSLLNLCGSLNKNGFSAKIYFYDIDNDIINSHIVQSYNVEQYRGELDLENNIVVAPETQTTRIKNLKKATKVVYWLGLLYYYKNPEWKFPFNYKIMRKLIACHSYAGYSNGAFELAKRRLNEYAKSKINIWTADYIHLSNSYFVTEYCKNKGAKHAYTIQNPVHDEFYDKDINPKREKYILLGQRSSHLFMWLLRIVFKDYKIFKLKRMSHAEVMKYLSKSTVFVELGINHGRDRLPREAALLGNVVFMNRRGSSSNKADYNLDKYYILKNNILNYFQIIKKIKNTLDNYQTHFEKQSEFRQQLIKEKNDFNNNVKKVFKQLMNIPT